MDGTTEIRGLPTLDQTRSQRSPLGYLSGRASVAPTPEPAPISKTVRLLAGFAWGLIGGAILGTASVIMVAWWIA